MHGFLQIVLVLVCHTEVRVEHNRTTVDPYCLCKVECCLFKLLLLLEDISETEPSVVMALISLQSLLIAFFCLLKVFVLNVLVTT